MNPPLAESWVRLKDHKIKIRNCYASGNKEGAVAHIRAAREELVKLEEKILSADRPAG